MTLVEGIGDEVLQFFILLILILVALIAWWSTSIPERHFVRTVLILERRSTRRTPEETQTAQVDLPEGGDGEPEVVEQEADKTATPTAEAADQVDEADLAQEEVVEDSVGQDINVPPLQEINIPSVYQGEPPSPISDASSILRHRRLAFFQPRRDDDTTWSSEVQSLNADLQDLIGHRTEEEVAEEVEQATEVPLTEGNIRIRLKYLNDDQKMVEGRLREQLGDFKKRHFNIELAGRKLVRLIFNGQVLQQDSKTLENYGLFDNCVVHCLVHQPRTPPPSPNLNRTIRNGMQRPETNGTPTWDLGNVLFASLSMLLGLAWYGRYQYAQLYTATTTVALVGLTGIFMVSLIGMYMPDADTVRA